MKNKTPLFIFIIVCLSFVLFLFSSSSTYAQTDQGFSLRVSPPILEIDIEPGSTYSDYLKFENLDPAKTVTLYPQVLSFKARGDDGGQEFITDNEETTSYSLAQWINISTDTLVIKPLERLVLPFTISVPEDAEPGGRYGAILVGNQPVSTEDLANSVALGAQSGTIILARIEGDLIESAKLSEFLTGKTMYQYPPVDFEITLENDGNVHVKPSGKIEIKNVFGSVVDEVVVNQSGGNVLPDSSRKFEAAWERDKFTLGRYSASLMLQYGEENTQYITDSLIFWVLPVKEIVIALVVLILVIVLLVVLIKSYNKMIVKKAMEMKDEVEQEKGASQS